MLGNAQTPLSPSVKAPAKARNRATETSRSGHTGRVKRGNLHPEQHQVSGRRRCSPSPRVGGSSAVATQRAKSSRTCGDGGSERAARCGCGMILRVARCSCRMILRVARAWGARTMPSLRGRSARQMKPKSADKPGSVTALSRYGRHSSRRAVAGALEPPTRGLGEQRRRPPTWCCSGWRLPRFTRCSVTRSDSSLWPCSSPSSAALTATYSGRALPGIPLCGARTFLPPGFSGGDGLAGFGTEKDTPIYPTRQARVSPARSGTTG